MIMEMIGTPMDSEHTIRKAGRNASHLYTTIPTSPFTYIQLLKALFRKLKASILIHQTAIASHHGLKIRLSTLRFSYIMHLAI